MSYIDCYPCFGAYSEVLDILDFNFDFHTGGKLHAHESVDNLLRGLDNVNQSLVRSHLELLTAVLVLVNRAEDRNDPSRGSQIQGQS